MFIIRIGEGDSAEVRIAYAIIPVNGNTFAFISADADGTPRIHSANEVRVIRTPIPPYVEAAWNDVLLKDTEARLDHSD